MRAALRAAVLPRTVGAVFPVGGVGVMLALIAVAGVACAGVAWSVQGPMGRPWAVTLGLLLWSLAAIAAVTLIPADGPPGIVPAAGRLSSCSWDLGGPAPDGFWILPGGQRLLNTLFFVPSGALLVLVAARWRWAVLLVPAGVIALGAYSCGIELTQLVLARIDRACDITDVVDNVTGALVGVVLGLALLPVVRPWRQRQRRG